MNEQQTHIALVRTLDTLQAARRFHEATDITNAAVNLDTYVRLRPLTDELGRSCRFLEEIVADSTEGEIEPGRFASALGDES